jgi:hypothetical protein
MIVCAWCRVTVRPGGEAVSHGMCEGCSVLFEAQVAVHEPRRRRRRLPLLRPVPVREGRQLALL